MGSPLPRKQVKGTLPFRRWYIATRLGELREAAGVSAKDAAARIERAPSTIYDIEDGTSVPQRPTLQALLRFYRADQATTSLLVDLRREPDKHEWWEPYTGDLPGDYGLYISCEKRAKSIHDLEAVVVPGLLQTDAYARAVIRGTLPGLAEAEVERRVEVRRKRRTVLSDPNLTQLHAIVDETALNRPIGGRDVMREQLTALLNVPASVTLQVMPLVAGAYPEMGWPFVVIQLRDPRAPTLVFTERSSGHSVVDGDEDLRRYAGTWERLAGLALDPKQSAQLIEAKL